jgi:hypothetical protein
MQEVTEMKVEGVGTVLDHKWVANYGRLLQMPGSVVGESALDADLRGERGEWLARVLKPFGMDETTYRVMVRKVALAISPRPAYVYFGWGYGGNRESREDLPGSDMALRHGPYTDAEFLADGKERDEWREDSDRAQAAHEAKWRAYLGDNYKEKVLPGCDR